MNLFEIATFENSDYYDGSRDIPENEVFEEYMMQYERYFPRHHYEQKDVWFQRGRSWISYRDKSGGDKPMTVFLIGNITDDLVIDLQRRVSSYYLL